MRNQPNNLGRFVLGMVSVILLAILCEECSAQVFADGFEDEAGPPVPETCHTSNDPANLPIGFTPYVKTWEWAFYGNSYPSSGNPLAPIGSFTLRQHSRPDGPPIAGRYIAIPFTPGDGIYYINWLDVQPIPEHDYGLARPADYVFITISPCMGDFRAPNSGLDPYLRPACRKRASNATITYSGTAFGPLACAVEVGEPHYINILFGDPLDPDSDSCSGDRDECEVMARHERQS